MISKKVSLFLSVTFLLFANVGASTNYFKVINFLEIKYMIFIGNSLIKCHKTRLYKIPNDKFWIVMITLMLSDCRMVLQCCRYQQLAVELNMNWFSLVVCSCRRCIQLAIFMNRSTGIPNQDELCILHHHIICFTEI